MWGVDHAKWGNPLTQCALEYIRCQVKWRHDVFVTNHRLKWSTKPLAYQNSEQVYKPKFEPVTNVMDTNVRYTSE